MTERKKLLRCGGLATLATSILLAIVITRDHPGQRSESQTAQELLEQRYQLDRTVWRPERIAQEHEEFFVELWDRLRAASDPLAELADARFESFVLPEKSNDQQLDDGILATELAGEERQLSPVDWRDLASRIHAEGFRLVESEWHHAAFEPDCGDGARSTISVVLHAVNESRRGRYLVTGDLDVAWRRRNSREDPPHPRVLTARNFRVLERTGPPPFEEAYRCHLSGPTELVVLVYDTNDDGLAEIVLPSFNLQFRNLGGCRFERQQLAEVAPGSDVTAAVLADFTGDGRADLMSAGHAVQLYVADPQGGFTLAPVPLATADLSIESPSVITAGDIDGDGDLDAWVAQYKYPMIGGQMPTPYYDANDGYLSYLLRNEGGGRWVDATVASGLAAKRNRRTYSATLVDLDADADLDLLVASDFAGLDAYENDGRGRYTDVTDAYGQTRRSFGMSLSLADYNLDGRLDFYMTGMGSTTARRLEALGLGRDEFPEHQANRMRMGYGNRMFLADRRDVSLAAFRQAPRNDEVARTGWSWGCTSLDFDNDGDRDIYVANGHKSRQTARDYCSRFWSHDIYIQSDGEDPQVEAMFHALSELEYGRMSWNGFEHNHLLMNGAGEGFLNVGFLMNVALEEDCRNVVSSDFDLDGRPDLLVVSQVSHDRRQTIRVLRNGWPEGHHWIGVRLRESPGRSALGARVVVHADGHPAPAAVVVGDSFRSQHAPTVHFGLGVVDRVDRIDVHWPDGLRSRIDRPAVDQYHEPP